MPYKDPVMRDEMQRLKWQLWREMKDNLADHDICSHCGLDIYSLDEERFTIITPRWYHFVDPKGLGIRPLGKNDPVYDLVRKCQTALKHRYIPEAFETHDGTWQGFDPRVGARDDMLELLRVKLEGITLKDVAEP